MVSDPEKYAPIFVDAGADMVTFHVEALDNDLNRISNLLKVLHEKGVKAGVVIKPKTDVAFIEPMVMTVEPGFGGQSFMKDMMSKVTWLKNKRDEKGYSYRIEVDGGINGSTYHTAIEAGSDTLVAGSYVFKGDIVEQVASLLR